MIFRLSNFKGCISRPNQVLAFISIDANNLPLALRPVSIHVLFTARMFILRKWRGNLVYEVIQQLDFDVRKAFSLQNGKAKNSAHYGTYGQPNVTTLRVVKTPFQHSNLHLAVL